MAIPPPSALKRSIVIDPTAQKLADLEGRIAKLEGALRIGPGGVVTLKSISNIVIESSSSVTIKSSSAMQLLASATLTLKGATINLN